MHPESDLRPPEHMSPSSRLEFRVLGPLEVLKDGQPLDLEGGRQRAALAILLLHPNKPLASDVLVSELWGDEPPPTASKMVQNYVSRLRRLLEPDGAGGAQQVLARRARGYELRIDPDQLDANLFERLVKEARHSLAAGAPAVAAEKLREGLALWRGPALADFADDLFAQSEIARLDELRLSALEDRIEAELATGRASEVIGELEVLVGDYPLRERLRLHLMLALYRSGRQAEALAVYHKTRQLLVERLGIEPSRSLQQMERAILRQDPALDLEPEPAAPRPQPEPAPRAREVRKTVTVVFAEVVARGRELDPEGLRRPLSRSLALLSTVLERHGGNVERGARTGAVAAVFGIPAVHEDDALRAVRAASELREALAVSNQQLEREWGIHLAVSAAVNTGEVVAEADGEGHGVVAGDAIDVAVRVQHEAAPDEVLLADSTYRLVERWVQAEAVGPVMPDGAASPARVWRLHDVVTDASALARTVETLLVGRERELDLLRESFGRAVREQTPYLFTLLGPAGIGKSRLAAEFGNSLRGDATVLTGRCPTYGEAVTFWPVAEIVRQLAGDDVRAGIAALLREESDAELIAERIESAMGIVETAQPTEETFWAARKLFETVARERPLVLVFEDLHWAEPTLLDLVEYLAMWPRDAAILLLCLARPELIDERPAWAGGKTNATTITLGPLSEQESRVLLQRLVGGAADLTGAAAAGIVEVAEGNPLFLEEMFAMLSQDGFGDGELTVPPTIQAVLGARLDRLPSDERAVLERAAVVGKEFSRGALVELLDEDDAGSVDSYLNSLVRRELVRPCRSLFAGDDAFQFRHALLRDAAYASVPKEARADLHERYAAWLERSASDRAREFEEIVGSHLEQAYRYRVELGPVDERARDVARQSAERLARAGRRAYAREDLPAASGLLSRAAELLAPPATERSELLVDLSEVLRETGDLDGADAALAEATEAAAASDDEALQWYARIARLRLQVQTNPEIKANELLRDATFAVDVFTRAGDERHLAAAWALLAWAPWYRCRAAEAEAALQRAIEHARRAGDRRTEAQSLNLLIGAGLFGPLPVLDAVRRCEEIISRKRAQQRVKASALRALAGLRAMQGEFDQARDLVEQHRTLVQELNLSVSAAGAAETYGIVEMLAGDPVAAERELRRGYEALERMGGEMMESPLAALLAQALYDQGRDEEALRVTELSEQAVRPDDLFAHIQWRAARARALARLGHHDDAERLAREAVSLAEETDFLNVHGDALACLAEVLRHAGRAEESTTILERAISLYETKGNVVSAARARAVLDTITASSASAQLG